MDEQLPVVASKPEAPPHADGFRVVIASLIAVALGAVAIAVAVAARGNHRDGTLVWSSWQPSAGGSAGVDQIAQHVAPLYRQSTSRQLAVVSPIKLTSSSAGGEVTGSGLTVAVNTAASTSTKASLSLLNGQTIAYNLCGIGAHGNCSLPGTSTAAKVLLLRREAFELALYTLEYIDSAENVVVVLPPGPAATNDSTTSTLTSRKPTRSPGSSDVRTVTAAVLFDRTELQPWLQVPLSETLAEFPPALSQLAAWTKTEEAGLVDEVTAHGLFSEQLESQQEGGNLLVLNPLPPQ